MIPKLALFAALTALMACGGEPPRQVETSTPSNSPAPDTAPKPGAPAKAAEPILIATDLRSYRPGDPVELRITNTTAMRYTFNPCTRVIEQRDDSTGTWTEVKEERICTMIAHVLEPDSTRTERTELGEALRPGTYRLAIRFSSDSPTARAGAVEAYTQPITVTP